MGDKARVIAFDRLRMGDVGEVGGKNASLGEMIGELGATGVRVPSGFATTATRVPRISLPEQARRANRDAAVRARRR